MGEVIMVPNRYAIYEGNMERLRKKLLRIQNKCAKFGTEFKYEEVGEEFREVRETDEDGRKYMETRRFVIVETEGKALLNEWEYIGSVEHTGNGNIILCAPEQNVPDRYFDSMPICEHCGTNRARKYTYIVRNTETGEYKQIGKSCLCDFTHGLSAEDIASYLSWFDGLLEAETPYQGISTEPYYPVKEMLGYAAEAVRCFGYTKSHVPGIGNESTKERTFRYYLADLYRLWPHSENAKTRDEMQANGVDPHSMATQRMVEKMIKWIAEADDKGNSYLHSLKVICSGEYTAQKNLGILASLPVAYDKEMAYMAKKAAKEAERQAQTESEYVGEVGKRIEVPVREMKIVTSWETDWGTKWMYRIIDTNGNVLIWKTTGGPSSCDSITTVVGTVKAHNEFRGVRQTELVRCKVA